MVSFFTSTLLTALAAASLVQGAPKDKPEGGKEHKGGEAAPASNKGGNSDKGGNVAPASQQAGDAAPAPGQKKGHLDRDYKILQAFADSVTVDPQNVKANWTAEKENICNWAGFACAMHPDGYLALAEVQLAEFGLGPDLPLKGFMDQLTDVTLFHVNGNHFKAPVPPLDKLEYLFELDLSANDLGGPFPTEVLLKSLVFLDLRFNGLTGPLPENLFTSTNSDAYFLNNNSFTGTLPEWDKQLKSLIIMLTGNQITGPIPDSWAVNTALQQLGLADMQLSGTIPDGLCGMKNLTMLDVSGNLNMTGTLGPKCTEQVHNKVVNIERTGLKLAG